MEVARPPSQLGTRPSRRSFPNLQHLSLAPLSSRFPIDDDGYDQEYSDPRTPRSSYIEGKSAPTTPGILSRASSRHPKPKKRVYVHEGHMLSGNPRELSGITKAKSSSALLFSQRSKPYNQATMTPVISQSPRPPPSTPADNDDGWFHRAGLTIASETREAKGQSWLASRASSTSLVRDRDNIEQNPGYDSHMALISGEQFADDEYSPATPRYSHFHSRAGSRAVSARNSRRGSRVGSRVDLITPLGPRTPSALAAEADAGDGYFGVDKTLVEPDFVEPVEEDVRDEEDVARLTQERGFGLGGWVDRLMDWTLFNVNEDGEETEDEKTERQESREEFRKRREQEVQGRQQKAKLATLLSEDNKENENTVDERKDEEEGGWKDAAWLLSVASKVLL